LAMAFPPAPKGRSCRVDASKMHVLQDQILKETELRKGWMSDQKQRVEKYMRQQGRSLPPVEQDEGVAWIGCKRMRPDKPQALIPSRSAPGLHHVNYAEGLPVSPTKLSQVSSASHFLDERFNLQAHNPAPWANTTLRDLLYRGVSGNQEGRHAYLQARRKLDPCKRNQVPATTFQEVGWQVQFIKPTMPGKAPRPSGFP